MRRLPVQATLEIWGLGADAGQLSNQAVVVQSFVYREPNSKRVQALLGWIKSEAVDSQRSFNE
jgi:hypothetical protein